MSTVALSLSDLFSTPHAPALIFVFGAISVLPVLAWYLVQSRKLRILEKKLESEQSQQHRDDIFDIHKKIAELKRDAGYDEDELERVKAQLVATLRPGKTPEGPNPVATVETVQLPVTADSVATQLHSTGHSSAKLFLTGLFQFGFLGIWSLGWGIGFGLILVPAAGDIWAWATVQEGGGWTPIWRAMVLLFGALALVGLWIVPTVGAFLGSVAGLLKMLAALAPGVTSTVRKTRLKKVWEQHVIGQD